MEPPAVSRQATEFTSDYARDHFDAQAKNTEQLSNREYLPAGRHGIIDKQKLNCGLMFNCSIVQKEMQQTSLQQNFNSCLINKFAY
jgi:hypothetical protein